MSGKGSNTDDAGDKQVGETRQFHDGINIRIFVHLNPNPNPSSES